MAPQGAIFFGFRSNLFVIFTLASNHGYSNGGLETCNNTWGLFFLFGVTSLVLDIGYDSFSLSHRCDMELESEEILSCSEKGEVTEKYLSLGRFCEHWPQSGK